MAVRSAEEFEALREILDNVPCAILTSRIDGTIDTANKTFFDWTHLSRSSIIGKTKFQDLLTMPGRLFYETHFRPLLHTAGEVNEISCLLVCGNGTLLPILVNSNLKRDHDEQPVAIRTTIFRATERTRYESELRKARARAEELAAIVQSSDDAILSIGQDGKILTWNTGATTMLGYTRQEALGKNLSEITLVEEQNFNFDLNATRKFDIRVRHKQGKPVDVSARQSPIFDSDGNALASSIIYRDMTEEIATHFALKQSEDRLASALRAGELGVHDHDLVSGKITWDKTVRRMWGVDGEIEITPAIFDAGVHPEDLPRVDEALAAAFDPAGNGIYAADYRVLGKDGKVRWVRADGLVTFEGPKPVRLVGTAHDYTKQKLTEVALRESEEKFKAAFENSSLPMSILSKKEGIYRDVNEACAKFFGYQKSEMIGKSALELGLYGDAVARDELRALLARNGSVKDFELVLRAAGGILRTHLLNADAMVLQGEECFYVVSSDVSERKIAEERLRIANYTFQHMVENSPFGIYAVDADFRIALVSAGAQTVFENVRPLLGRDLGEVLRILWPEPFASEAISIFRNTLATGQPYLAPSEIQTRRDIPEEQTYDWKVERLILPDGRFGVVCHFYDLSERQKYEETIRNSEAKLRLAIELAGIGISLITYATDTIVLDETSAEILVLPAHQPLPYRAVHDRFHPDDARTFLDTIDLATVPGSERSIKVEVRVLKPDATIAWVSIRKQLDFQEVDGNLRIVNAVMVMRDITPRKSNEQKVRLLLAEVSHRSKNLLSVVQSVARQTGKSGEPQTIIPRLLQRIAGLAASQDLLVSGNWQGVEIGELAKAQLSGFVDALGARVKLSGERFELAPSNAQAIGMAFHELATNAAKYGALSTARGRLEIAWEIDRAKNTFMLSWVERDGPPIAAPTRAGFGQRVIIEMVESSLGGKVQLNYPAPGLVWQVNAPLDKLNARNILD